MPNPGHVHTTCTLYLDVRTCNVVVCVNCCCQGARDRDGDVVDHDRARTDAQAMYQAGEAKWGTDESKSANTCVHIHLTYTRMCVIPCI